MSTLEALLRRTDLWRGTAAPTAAQSVLPTGHAALDALLPGGGWPLGALTELCHAHPGMGELRVLMPALAQLARERRWIVLAGAPHPFHAPALAAAGLDLERVVIVTDKKGSEPFSGSGKTESMRPITREKGSDPFLWAAEQALRSGACGAVLLWPRSIDDRGLRRLQLAAEAGRNWGVALRPLAATAQASPAALRLQLESGPRVRILKCRGATRAAGITPPLVPAMPPRQVVAAATRQAMDPLPLRKPALPSLPLRGPSLIHAIRNPHALAGARISAPGTGCPR